MAGRIPTSSERVNAVRSASQRHGVPALISFFIPGLGQLIKGDWVSALFFFVAGAIGGALCFAGIGFVLLPILWIWNLYDAYVSPDGQTKRELKRLAKLAIILAFALGGSACGSVTAIPPEDGGTGGIGGAAGVETGQGGDAQATGGSHQTGGSTGSGGIVGTGGATGGSPGTGGCSGGQTLCGSNCVSISADNNNCGSCGRACGAGKTCTNGSCTTAPGTGGTTGTGGAPGTGGIVTTGTGGAPAALSDCTAVYTAAYMQPIGGNGTACSIIDTTGNIRDGRRGPFLCITGCRDTTGAILSAECTSTVVDPGTTVACVLACSECS